MSYLALTYSPEQLVAWWRRDDSSRRYYADDFERVFGLPLARAWQDWIAWEHEFQQKNLAAVAEHPITPHQDVARSGLGAISRAYLAPDGDTLYAAVRYPGECHTSSPSRCRTARGRAPGVPGQLPYRVTSLAFDPDGQTLFYTTDSFNYRNLLALDLKTHDSRMLIEDARIGDIVFNRVGQVALGLARQQRVRRARTAAVRTPTGSAVRVSVQRSRLGPRSLRRRHACGRVVCGAGRRGHRIANDAAARDVDGESARGRRDAREPSRARHGHSGRLCVLAGRSLSLRQLLLHRRFEHLSRGRRHGELEALSNASWAISGPLPLDERTLLVFRYSGAGFVPATIPVQPTEDLSAITFLGERIAATADRAAVEHELAVGGGLRDVASRPSSIRRSASSASNRCIPSSKATRIRSSFGLHARFSDPVGFDTLVATAGYSPDDNLRSKRTVACRDRVSPLALEVRRAVERRGFLRPVRSHERSREGYSPIVGYERPLIYSPRGDVADGRRWPTTGISTRCRRSRTSPSPSDRLFTANLGLEYKYPRASIGWVDDETGHLWGLSHTVRRG